MDLFYPYNEILPLKKAHDVYIVSQCHALAKRGLSVTLACGRDSLADGALHSHYNTSQIFDFQRLRIVRKNNPLKISWNLPFFWQAQRVIERERPKWVFLSVVKQGIYHLKRRVSGVRYLYEVHQLDGLEREMLERADLVTVPTNALREMLLRPPYSLSIPVEVVPLAVHAEPLPPPPKGGPLTLYYVGQLYEGQGLPLLLKALSKTPKLMLKVIGGTEGQIAGLKELAQDLGVAERVDFLGFYPPSKLPVAGADAFVAPFEATGRMPYVAHTKLVEYAAWGRPVVAPDLPVVREHLPDHSLLFTPGDVESLAEKLSMLRKGLEVAPRSSTWEKRAAHYHSLIYPKACVFATLR